MVNSVVVQGNKVDLDMARRIAARFETEITYSVPESKDAAYFIIDKSGVSFVKSGQFLNGDFTRMLPRVTGGHLQHEILLKASRLEATPDKGMLRAVDATAGLGDDSFILAAGGFTVEMYEHNPVTAVLLRDALIRGKQDPKLREIASRMSLIEGDSKDLLLQLDYTPDLVYLDPMFPEKKKSAETKKKLQMLRLIELPCSDENELLKAAMDVHARKIVIKRPPGGKYLGGIRPSYSIVRKAVRFDCITWGNSD